MPPYELIYWPGLPGRGEFIRLVFEDGNTPYTDHSTLTGPQEVLTQIAASNTGSLASGPPPLFCPILRHGETVINQTPNIVMYLGTRLGLAPSPVGADGGSSAAFHHVTELVMSALDGLCNETHDTHHPIASGEYYDAQREPAAERARDYRKNRLPTFLAYFQRVLDGAASGDGPWLYGGSCTVADLVLFQCIDGHLFAFPKAMNRLKATGKYDGVFALYDAVKARAGIAAYLKSERRQAYGDGIYRQYPELDDQADD